MESYTQNKGVAAVDAFSKSLAEPFVVSENKMQ